MKFNYKKNSKHILIATITSFLMIWLFSLALLFFYKPIYIESPHKGHRSFYANKEFILKNRNINKNTIFIISGSNSAHGISSKLLEEKLDNKYIVIVVAENAGYPFVFLLNFIKPYLKNGDIIIAPLEYNNLAQTGLTEMVYTEFSSWASMHKSFLPQKMQKELLLKNIKTYWTRIPNIFKEMPPIFIDENKLLELIKNDEPRVMVNKYFEIFFDKPTMLDNKKGYNYNVPQKDGGMSTEELIKLNKYFKENDIQLYVTYPVTVKGKLHDVEDETIKQQLANYRNIFKNMEIDFFGTPSFSNLDISYFFDTQYHPNATGQLLRTLLLAEDIKTYILGQEPSYEAGQEQAFFEQKEKEALEYMEMLREYEKEMLTKEQ